MPLIPILPVLPAGCYTAVLGRGKGSASGRPCRWESYLGSLARSSPCSTWLRGRPWSSSYGTHPSAARRTHRCTSGFLPECHMCQHRERRGGKHRKMSVVWSLWDFFFLFKSWFLMYIESKCVGVRPPPSLIPDMLTTIHESAGAALESAEALLQWMLCETNKHPPPPAPGSLPRDSFVTQECGSTVKGSLFIYSKKLFLVCSCEVQRRPG